MQIIKNLFGGGADKKKAGFCSAIIVAAGSGTRMGYSKNKLFLTIADRPVLAYTLQSFEECKMIDEVILVTRQEDIMLCKEIIDISGSGKVSKIIAGGRERQHSVYNGLKEISNNAALVAVHDGARPFVLPEHIEAAVKSAWEHGAAALGVRVKDTIKVVDEDLNIVKTPDRSRLWSVQTPQVFRVDILKAAHEEAAREGIEATDDCALVERMGYTVKMVEGSYKNIKITTPEDILFAEAIVEGREWEEEDEE
ncbi:MAG: 2-C-methyl-D-erythritol 4-phosphate cytidylyltransferase [Clostridiaceae bacterium]|nr:2-C-methyl-D-erythritol 4-phosphate cytidylyltransferase [Clostridiaceae bacterium]